MATHVGTIIKTYIKMSLTTDPKDPKLKEGQKNETGQHEIYLVLSEEERDKGFVRPVRDSYVHVGRYRNYAGIDKMLTEDEQKEMMKEYPHPEPYVAVLGINGSDGKHLPVDEFIWDGTDENVGS